MGTDFTKQKVSVLHYFTADSDLSFVGQEDCGHMRIDDEIQTSFGKLCIRFDEDNAYILVSIPMMARWHTSSRFNAEHIFLQSGKFHFSDSQFYHSAGCYRMGRLPVLFTSGIRTYNVSLKANMIRSLFVLIEQRLRWSCTSPLRCQVTGSIQTFTLVVHI